MWIDQIRENVRKLADKVAIRIGDYRILYKDLYTPLSNKTAERAQLIIRNKAEFGPAIVSAWLNGQVAIPIDPKLPLPAIEYQRFTVDRFKHLLRAGSNGDALVLFTSGTTGAPKGVIHTFASIEAQIKGLGQVWQWKEEDNLLLPVPLTHVHGLITGLASALSAGATVEIIDEFEVGLVWNRLLEWPENNDGIFTAVPTIYAKLLEHQRHQAKLCKSLVFKQLQNRYRMMICGSAPLSSRIQTEWEELTSHKLVERYGTTETGIVLSTSPFDPNRRSGLVGSPLSGVKTQINDEGELLISGPTLFRGYLDDSINRAVSQGAKADIEGWYTTGDLALQMEDGFRITGRTKEIIKVGGYRVSGSEVEKIILDSPVGEKIKEVAIMGAPDETYGEKIVAFYVSKDDNDIDETLAHSILKNYLASYQLPRQWKKMAVLPRNYMGKIEKTVLAATM